MLQNTHDQLTSFIFDDLEVRGEVVQLHDVYNDLFKNKQYPLAVKKILAQLAMICNMITVNLKHTGDITVEIRGDGLLRYATISSDKNLNFRGIARHNIADPNADINFKELVGPNAVLLVTLHPQEGEPYQGIVEITGYSLSDTLENYFDKSDQIKTQIMLEIQVSEKECFGGGIIVQALPTNKPEHEDDFNTVQHILNTLTKNELLYLEADEILFRLFNQYTVRKLRTMPVTFKCACSRNKCLDALSQLGMEEVEKALQGDSNNTLSMTCSQCGKAYMFTREELKKFFEGLNKDKQ